MLSLAHSITGTLDASFWMEATKEEITFHLSSKSILDKEKKEELLQAATSRKNEAAGSFLGWLRDAFENALLTEPDRGDEIPEDILPDLANHSIESTEYDGFERSVLKRLADNIKVSIRGDVVDMTVLKKIA
jgi:hypothetical protein